MKTSRKINDSWLTLFLFIAALAVRLIYLEDLQKNPLFDTIPESMDHYNFDQAAKNFAEGDWLARSVNNAFSPLYKYFLGCLYWISGSNYYFAYFIQFSLGAFSTVLVFKLTRLYFGIRAGFFSWLGITLFSTHIVYEGILLRAAFISFLGLWSCYLVSKIEKESSMLRLIVTTLVLSVFFQARPNTLLVLPVVCLYFHFKVWREESWTIIIRKWAVFGGVLLGSFAPLLVQCYIVHGKFVLFDASGPHTFIAGNLSTYSGVGFDLHVIEEYRNQNVLGYVSNVKYLISHIAQNPVDFIFLYLRKLFFFFNNFESPTNISVYLYREFSPFLSSLWNHFSLFSALGLAGLTLAFREKKPAFLLYGYILTLSLAILIFLNESRYRIPVTPYFIIFFGYAADEILKSLQKQNWHKTLIFLSVSGVLLFCFQEIPGLNKTRPDDFNNMAVAWIEKNQVEKADDYLTRGLTLFPDEAQTIFNKGQVHFIQEEWELAQQYFSRALNLKPGMTEAKTQLEEVWFQRSKIEMQLNNFKKAANLLEKFLQFNSDSIGARGNLGVCYANLGKDEKAREQFLKVLELEPKNGSAQTNLAILNRNFD
tara:strand:- start:479 stop:2263 length:1785 start_codon:yes stop_codon:yes gene_type:complete